MTSITLESPSVQSYLQILQSVINRMAANSAGCKTWCITIVSAIAVLVTDKRDAYVFVALAPIVLFWSLDAYYLALERQFRDLYNDFIRKLHDGNAKIEDVFIVSPGEGGFQQFTSTFAAAWSASIFPFYALLLIMLGVLYRFVL